MFKHSLLALILCFLGLAAALHSGSNTTLNSTLKKSYFFINSSNPFSSEFYQTRNGIVTFSIETINNTKTSQYLLIDIPKRDAKPILRDIAKACELVTPTFQPIHYHIQTSSLVYFCHANNSLLVIDQSTYSVEQVIPFNTSGSWPIVKISTDEKGIAILLMDNLFTPFAKASILLKVNLEVRQVTAEILLNRSLFIGEAVVAYASSKNAAYIATNRIQVRSITTTIYSFINNGSSYQITPIVTFNANISSTKLVTKLFVVGSSVVANNGQDLYFIKNGIYSRIPQVHSNDQHGLSHLAMTSQYGSNDLYIQMSNQSVYKYTVIENKIHYQQIGDYEGIQIAHGNQTSGDLMFTTNSTSGIFDIINLQNMQPIYTAVSGYDILMLTNSTYAVVRSHDNADYYVHIFNLKNDTLIASIPIEEMYYYTKEQNMISYFSYYRYNCFLTHIDLATAKIWTTSIISSANMVCGLQMTSLRITEHGNAEFIAPMVLDFIIYTEGNTVIDFEPRASVWLSDARALNFDFDKETFYYLDPNITTNITNVTYYSWNAQTQQVEYKDSNLIGNLSFASDGYCFINSTTTAVVTTDKALALINGLGNSTTKYHFSGDWNSATSFEDYAGNQFIVLTKATERGSAPGLFTNGRFISLPGVRDDSVRAQAAGPNSYWIADAFGSSAGLVRFYDAAGSNSNGGQNLISI